ncbi:hypothetical protein [Novosphingobium sp. ST904]|uniref:hypothetical protein n=1 Tax=Novosphingobium sp. ST904 TaxID=1684385 RepID=UPI0012E101FD|nr:hypothetical protein [Novosphingobium sp. ST904]
MRIVPVFKGVALVALGAALLQAGGAGAEAPSVPAPASTVPGWSDFLDGLRDLPDRILARIPAEQRSDPQVRQEAGRLALSAVAARPSMLWQPIPTIRPSSRRSTITSPPASPMPIPITARRRSRREEPIA